MKSIIYYIIYPVILLLFIPVSILLSQNLPEYKNRSVVNKPLLFPISENQKMYDIKSYDMNFDFNLTDTTFRGESEITLKVSSGFLSFIHLDLAANSIFKRRVNTVDSVFVSGKKSTFSHNDTTLNVDLDRNYYSAEIVKIKIFYRCKLDNFYLMLFNKFNRPLLFNLSEPFGARFWFPCKDYPEDKADSVRMKISVPESYYAVSNGKLEKISVNGGKKTFIWVEKYPISTYLISIAAYPYLIYEEEYKSTVGKNFTLYNYVMPEDTAAFNKVRGSLHNIMNYFENRFGEYPFSSEKYAHAQIAFSGGMENQTVTSIGIWNEYLMTHELAHSWFGNSITCKDFHNIWLNEGFATYFTALYLESVKGKPEFEREMNARRYFGEGKIFRENMNDDMSVFHEGLVYSKAAWVLHMLRHITGDENFFAILKNYYNQYKYSVADETDFRNECEKIYGNNLEWFFNQWIHGEYYPHYNPSWRQIEANGKFNLSLEIEQLPPATQIFKMPVDVTFKSGSWDTTIVVWDSLKIQKFEFSFQRKIDSLFIDKNGWILKKIYTEPTNVKNYVEPGEWRLYQNYPNPFNSSSAIIYSVKKAGNISIKLYNILGKEIKTLKNGYSAEGTYRIDFEAGELASGVYYYILEAAGYRDVKKMMLLR